MAKLTADFDPEQLVQEAIDAGISSSVFELDDRDIPQAPNVIRWCLGAEFLNSTLFTKQAEVLIQLFAEFCPTCSDKEYLKNVPVEDTSGMGEFQDRVQLLDFGRCPKCKKNRIELFDTIPEELVAVWGQRSGKSVVVASKAATYQLHRFLKIPNVARYFGQDAGQQFDMVFVAITSSQAQSTLWSKFLGAYQSSPWFKDYNSFLEEKAREFSFKKDYLFKAMETYTWYGGSKNILATYKPSDLKTLRGDTRLWSATDEFGWMSNDKESAVRANGQEVYTSLNNSLRTVRAVARKKHLKGDFNCPTAIMCNVSSPSSVWDPIMTLLKEGERDKRKICSHLPTWEVNPQITRKDLENDFILKPEDAARDFGAEPPLASNPFLGSVKNLDRIKDTHLRSLFRYKVEYIGDAVSVQSKYLGAKLIESSLIPDKTTPRLIAVDAGETGNSFAISVYSIRFEKDREPSIIVDAVVEVKPEFNPVIGENIPVHFPTMSEFILKLVEKLNIIIVCWDRWQSTGEIQRLRDKKIRAEKFSPRWEDFLTLRANVWAGNVRAPCPEVANLLDFDITNTQELRLKPWSHFYIQMATVREVGRRVAKPMHGEDDMFRTLVLASCFLTDPEILKLFQNVGSQKSLMRQNKTIGISSSYGSSSRGGTSSGASAGRIVAKTRSSR